MGGVIDKAATTLYLSKSKNVLTKSRENIELIVSVYDGNIEIERINLLRIVHSRKVIADAMDVNNSSCYNDIDAVLSVSGDVNQSLTGDMDQIKAVLLHVYDIDVTKNLDAEDVNEDNHVLYDFYSTASTMSLLSDMEKSSAEIKVKSSNSSKQRLAMEAKVEKLIKLKLIEVSRLVNVRKSLSNILSILDKAISIHDNLKSTDKTSMNRQQIERWLTDGYGN